MTLDGVLSSLKYFCIFIRKLIKAAFYLSILKEILRNQIDPLVPSVAYQALASLHVDN
jgi:hypothetical protein